MSTTKILMQLRYSNSLRCWSLLGLKGLTVCQLLIFVLCFGFFNSELCELPPVTGPCRAAFPRWYYNSTVGECLEFTYGGCMGNGNNFHTENNCTETCAPSVVAQKGLC